MTVASLLLPLTHAVADESTGSFSFRRAVLEGSSHARGDAIVLLIGPEGNGTPGFSFSAERAVVNTTTVDVVQASGTPVDPSRPASIQSGPARFNETTINRLTGRTSSFEAHGQVLFRSTGASFVFSQELSGTAALEASKAETWRIGPNAESPASANDERNRVVSVPAGFPAATGPGHDGTIQGDLALFFWRGTLEVSNATQEHVFRSDQQTLQESPSVLGAPSFVRHQRFTLVEIHLTNATVGFDGAGHGTRILGPMLATETMGTASILGARGDLQNLTHRTSLEGGPLNIEGTFVLRTGLDASDTGLISADFAGRGAGVHAPFARTTPVPSDSGLLLAHPLIVWPTALAAIGVLGWYGRRRLVSRNRLAKAEAELMAGRPERALRIARPLVRQDPTNAHAVFLYGAALFQAGHTKTVTTEVDDLAQGIPRHERGGIALLLALANAHEQDFPRAEKWAKEAENQSAYRAHLGTRSGAAKATGPAKEALPGYS